MRIRKFLAGVIVLLALVGCATGPSPGARDIRPFSRNVSGAAMPIGWEPLIITRAKAPTDYRLVVDAQRERVVVQADADSAATGLKQRLDVDPRERPVIRWDWRIEQLIREADNRQRHGDDAPVRLLLFFDGDHRRLPAREQVLMETARLLSGQPVPYATLMYIWENRQPVDTLIANTHTSRVRMIVAGSGSQGLGRWKRFQRNYVEDFERAFGEPPGRLIGVGILTDTDNTRSHVRAYYGDIRLKSAAAGAWIGAAEAAD